MVHLKVFYNPSADYNANTDKNANILVSIDEMPVVETLAAHAMLFGNRVYESITQTNEQAPVGIFSIGGICHTMNDGIKCINKIKHIDYKTITEEDLEQILQDRFSEVKHCLIDPDIKIECVRGVPPT